MTYRLTDKVAPLPVNLGYRSRATYQNVAEEKFRAAAQHNGWELSKRVWPDFLCVKNGEIIVVEVKPTRDGQPKLEQLIVLEWFAAHGIKAFMWNPETGFRRVRPRSQ